MESEWPIARERQLSRDQIVERIRLEKDLGYFIQLARSHFCAAIFAHGRFVGCCRWSARAKRLGKSVRDGERPVRRGWQAHADTIFDLSVSRDGKQLATASGDHLVKIWELASGKEITQLEHPGAALGVSFNTNATEVVTITTEKQLKIWNVKTRESVVTVTSKKRGFNAMAWSADGKVVAASDDDGALLSYSEFKRHSGAQSSDTATERKLGRWPEPLHSVAVSKDGKLIAAGGQDGIVYVVKGDGKLLAKLEPEAERGVLAAPSDNSERAKTDRVSGAVKTPRPTITPSFVRDVLPALAKAGCMAGSCHAKAEGQNGFKLSVFSYDPKSDYAEILKEARGRRVFPAAPSESLLLLKPTATIEHGGGERFEVDSETYKLLANWIQRRDGLSTHERACAGEHQRRAARAHLPQEGHAADPRAGALLGRLQA